LGSRRKDYEFEASLGLRSELQGNLGYTETLSQEIKGAGGVDQWVEHLHRELEALSSNLSTTKEKTAQISLDIL
jgi:hypothetical protein